jgi:hypothetical protein
VLIAISSSPAHCCAVTYFAAFHERKFAALLAKLVSQDVESEQAARKQKLQRLESREQELDALFELLYEDRAKGLINENRFIKMSGKYECEQKEVDTQLKLARQEAELCADKGSRIDDFVGIVRSCADIRKLTPRILHLFVDYIEVGQAKRIQSGWRQKIDIHYNFVGKVDIPVVEKVPEPILTMKAREGVDITYSLSGQEAKAS